MNGLLLRRSVRNLPPPALAELRDAMRAFQALNDNRGYNFIAGFHGVPFFTCWHHQQQRGNPRPARLFLPWHRVYLFYFELNLRASNSAVSLPWWDWSSTQSRSEGLPRAYAEARDAAGQPNPLRRFRINQPTANPPIRRNTRRSPGSPQSLPFPNNPNVVQDLLTIQDWSDFSDQLQDTHDFIHGWTGGDMGSVGTASYDPIFWAHHCMVDRVWYLWQLRHGNSTMPEEILDMALGPFNVTVRQVLNIQNLGYDYAGTEITIA